ncbi:DUF2092 domain-containing protein [Streptomyces sp. NPDC005805]|uniref:LolA family protein n=1 Tax=Streptomyces sp. NPDC005805 TaxID=3157068 RepID=UPI0033E1B943
MAPNDSAHTTGEAPGPAVGRRRAARYVVPLAVAGVAAGTIGLVPALANSGDPELPKVTARELIEKIAASDTQQLSGTVKISTDLGLPAMDGLLGSVAGASGDGASADPRAKLTELASGTHTLRIAADGPERQKLTLVDGSEEYSLIRNGDEVWAWDSASKEAFRAEEPAGEHGGDAKPDPSAELPATPKEFADELLEFSGDTTSYRVGGTARVAGRDAYQLVVAPEQKGSTVKSVTIAVDAKTGTPLKFTLTPSGGGKAVIDAGFTRVDFAKPAASTFDFTPPKGAKITEADEVDKAAEASGADQGRDKAKGKDDAELPGGPAGLLGAEGPEVIGEGWTSILTVGGSDEASGNGKGQAEKGELPAEAGQFLDSIGDKVSGRFGTGTVFSTRLVNALMTDDGTVYVGAVTKDALLDAANKAAKG